MERVEATANRKPGFQLNLHNRKENPLFESHDPSMMKDPVSGYYYSYGTDAAITSNRELGIPIRKSKDLVQFTYVGTALEQDSIQEAISHHEFGKSPGLWAPFVEYIEELKEYRMYYSATKAFGSSESKIWLAVSTHPEGPFVNRGVVMDTWFTSDLEPNGIDAHIIDSKEGRKYLIYGSFFGGIYGKEIDKKSGLSIDLNPRNIGFPIAKKPSIGRLDGPEGAAILYNETSDYYYLFLSYGWLGDDYDIRVARSKEVEGPYVDYHGRFMFGDSYGLKIANSYCFYGDKPYAAENPGWTFDGFRGPGHGVPFYEEILNAYFFVHHIRDGAIEYSIQAKMPGERNTYFMHYMMIRRMVFVNDWPVLSPEPYCGEAFQIPNHEEICGNWEWVIFSEESNECVRGLMFKPKILDFDLVQNMININVMELDILGTAFLCYDFENSKETLCFTGISKEGICVWGKKK